MRVQGVHPEAAHDLFAAQQITSIVFDVELIYLARRRGYRIGDRPGPLERPARLADARRGPGLALTRRLGPVPDPAAPPRGRGRVRRGRDARRLTVALARAALPILAIARLRRLAAIAILASRRRHARATTTRPTARPPQRLLDGQPLYDPAVDLAGGFAIFLLPAAVRGRSSCRSRCSATRPGCRRGRRCSSAAFVAGVALMPVSRDRCAG